MFNRPLVMVSHSKHMFKVELHFLLSLISYYGLNSNSVIPVLRTAEKLNMAIIDTVQLQ